MRELNNIAFETDEDIRCIARTSKEHDITSHGGSPNTGTPIEAKKIFQAYAKNAGAKAAAFEKFVVALMK